MKTRMYAGRIGVLLLAVLAAAGCKKSLPDEEAPWVVVLDQASTRALAEQRARQLEEEHPKLLEACGVLTVADRGMHTHLVVSRGHPNRGAAEQTAAAVRGDRVVRLPVVDATSLRLAGEEEEPDTAVPEGAGHLERLAASLPAPGTTARLEAFLLLSEPGGSAWLLPASFGYKSPPGWWKELMQLGWKEVATATYLSACTGEAGAGGDGRVLVLLGWPEDGGEQDHVVRKLHAFLLARVAPTDEEREAIEREKKQHRRKRRWRRRRRHEPVSGDEPVEPVELPKAEPGVLPWGPGGIRRVKRVGFLPRDKQKRDTPLHTAWLARGPGGSVMLVLVPPGCAQAAGRLLSPRLLGPPRGIADTGPVRRAWSVLPEVLPQGERLVTLAMDDLEARLDRKRRRAEWASRLAGRPVYTATYRTPSTGWQVTWVDLGSEPDAKQVFEAAYVKPRQEMIQRTVLGRKRSVRYDVGVSLREIGTTQGWYLRGARRGRLQELYFRLGSNIWLLEAPTRGEKAFGADDLLARVELLRIWPEDD